MFFNMVVFPTCLAPTIINAFSLKNKGFIVCANILFRFFMLQKYEKFQYAGKINTNISTILEELMVLYLSES